MLVLDLPLTSSETQVVADEFPKTLEKIKGQSRRPLKSFSAFLSHKETEAGRKGNHGN